MPGSGTTLRGMREILFFHGFYQIDPESGSLLKALRSHLAARVIHAPTYHPNGEVAQTGIGKALELFRTIASHLSCATYHYAADLCSAWVSGF